MYEHSLGVAVYECGCVKVKDSRERLLPKFVYIGARRTKVAGKHNGLVYFAPFSLRVHFCVLIVYVYFIIN